MTVEQQDAQTTLDHGLLPGSGRGRSHRKHGLPEIFNPDQGSQFSSSAFVGLLQQHGIRQSMDCKSCWRDNVIVERFWKSIKYKKVYLHAYDSVSAAKAGITRYVCFYNSRRPHKAIDRRTPDTVDFSSLPLVAAA